MLTSEETAKQRRLIHNRLLAPFTPDQLEVRPGATSSDGSKALPLFYIDAATVIQRLNQVIGFGNYSITTGPILLANEYSDVFSGKYPNRQLDRVKQGLLVATSVTITIDIPGILTTSSSNVGEKGHDESGYNKVTSAFAQALKRAASQLGIGAYLYNLKTPFYKPYDSKTKKFTGNVTPTDEELTKALIATGFKLACEETGSALTWLDCARSLEYTGKILCKEEAKKTLL